MKSHATIGWFACLVIAGLGLSAHAAEWGTITGRIVYDGKSPELKPLVVDKDQAVCGANRPDESLEVGSGGGLKNALVWLRTDGVEVAPEYEASAKEPVVLDNSKCRFEPHVLVMRTSQVLKIKNSDTAGHNTKLDAQANAAFNYLLPAGGYDDKDAGQARNASRPRRLQHPHLDGRLRADPARSLRCGQQRQGRVYHQGPAGRQGAGISVVAGEGGLPGQRQEQGREGR